MKPANVLIADDGRAMLADFGIASVVGASITTTGSNPYTLAYAPPEVLRGEPADARSDVYAVGSTIFEMLEGSPPFATFGLTQVEILGRALNQPAPPLTRADVAARAARAGRGDARGGPGATSDARRGGRRPRTGRELTSVGDATPADGTERPRSPDSASR